MNVNVYVFLGSGRKFVCGSKSSYFSDLKEVFSRKTDLDLFDVEHGFFCIIAYIHTTVSASKRICCTTWTLNE